MKLGCVMPGETPQVFGDALRRLAASATYLYQDGSRFWYGTQPTVTKLAEDLAEQYKREPDRMAQELEERLRTDLRSPGDFSRVHALPRSGADVSDELEARLIVLGADYPYSKESGNAAEKAAQAILESRGNTPRLYRNTLVFLAADKVRLQDLDEALRRFLAWDHIVRDADKLNLDPHQARQAAEQRKAADGAVAARLPETYQWVLVPEQKTASAPIGWQAIRLSGSGALAPRVSKKLRTDDLLVGTLGSTVLRKYLDEVPLWRGQDHVSVRQVVEDFARYLYLPRLHSPDVLVNAIRDGVALLTWRSDTFAYAESYDDGAKRYRGIRGGQVVSIAPDSVGLLVKPHVAWSQMDAEVAVSSTATVTAAVGSNGSLTLETKPAEDAKGTAAGGAQRPRRYYGTVVLDASRVGRDASRIAEEVIAHLVAQLGAEVNVTLEIEAAIPGGASEQVVRTVTENARTLKFTSQSFESE